jgi:hypothetical protein
MSFDPHTNTPELKDKAVWGVVAEFDSPQELIAAGRKLHHELGYKKLDALTPFPVHGIDDAIGVPPSILGRIVFCLGACGAAIALHMIWYTNKADYPQIIGGKPLFAIEPSVPVMFELTVLLSAFAAVFGMLALNGLPRFYHPTFNYERFRGATDDKFLLVVEAGDPKFDITATPKLLASLGARRTEVVEA